MADNSAPVVSTGTGVGPTDSAVAQGAVASSVYDNYSTQNITTTNNDSVNQTQRDSYAAAINLGSGSTGNQITSTTTDFGALNAAAAISETAIASNAQGVSLLTGSLGRALDTVTEGIKNAATPASQTVAKYSTLIFGVLAVAVVLGIAFVFRKGKRND